MRMFRVCSLLLLATAIAAGSGCSKGSSEPQPGASQGNEAPAAPATGTVPQTKLTDGQISQILATVDSSEIEQAQVALKKTNNPDVRAYATHMVEQHTASKQAGAQLTSQTTLEPAESPKAVELQTRSTRTLQELEAADAATFDQIYLQGQIQQHEEVLSMIDDQLLPAVNEPALRDHLTNARGAVQQHLEQARKISQR